MIWLNTGLSGKKNKIRSTYVLPPKTVMELPETGATFSLTPLKVAETT